MKVDLYTKIVLTAFAIALFLNVMKTVSPMTALAQLGIPYEITIHHTGSIGQLPYPKDWLYGIGGRNAKIDYSGYPEELIPLSEKK